MGSITKLLGDQIFTLPIHWTSATAFPETATHAIDFGPGGLSGIGPLTSRNLEGRGVRVIVVGDKGKGDVELYNARDVRYEDWWAKSMHHAWCALGSSRLLIALLSIIDSDI